MRTAAAALVSVCALAVGPAFAGGWTELGDAGNSLASAQLIPANVPTTSLNSIGGTLSDQLDVDLYMIHISDPASFSATTVGGNLMDTQLFLFALNGTAIYTNNDDLAYSADASSFPLSTLPVGHNLGPITAGYYLLGISLSGNDPVNANNELLFANGLPTDVRGPAGNQSPATLSGFTGLTSYDENGAYAITLTGADMTAPIPEPATNALMLAGLGLCGLAASRKGRRAAATEVAA